MLSLIATLLIPPRTHSRTLSSSPPFVDDKFVRLPLLITKAAIGSGGLLHNHFRVVVAEPAQSQLRFNCTPGSGPLSIPPGHRTGQRSLNPVNSLVRSESASSGSGNNHSLHSLGLGGLGSPLAVQPEAPHAPYTPKDPVLSGLMLYDPDRSERLEVSWGQ